MSKQANLFPVDVEQVWHDFVVSSDWDADAAKKRESQLQARLADLRKRKEKITEDCDAVEKELGSLTDRERKAKAHLESAAKGMGRFASPAVLLTSLLEHFPPLKVKKGRKGAAPATDVDTPEEDDVPLDNKVRASMIRSFILGALDFEGMKIADMLATATATDGKFTYGEMSTALREMIAEGLVRTLGGRGKAVLYAKPEPAT